MINKNITRILVLLLIITASVLTSSCYNDENGDAVVTIHLERNDLAANGIQYKEGIIDKILNLFSSRAEASGTIWPSGKSNLILSITSDSFDKKTFTIPPASTSYTITLPAESTAALTITSNDDWNIYTTDPNQKNWGGQTTSTFKSGEQDITIQMLPMTYITSAYRSTNNTINFIFTNSPDYMPTTVKSYKLYRSASIDGSYVYVKPTTTSPVNDTVGGAYYYRVSTVCDLGDGVSREGVMCDPVFAILAK